MRDPNADNIPFENPAQPSGRPGARVPYAKLRGPGGEISPRQLLGPYFAVYTAAPGGTEIAPSAAETLGIKLRVFAVDSVEPLHAKDCDTVLVRPDGIVAWRGRGPDGVETALRRILYR